jgi:hypothetical protein
MYLDIFRSLVDTTGKVRKKKRPEERQIVGRNIGVLSIKKICRELEDYKKERTDGGQAGGQVDR